MSDFGTNTNSEVNVIARSSASVNLQQMESGSICEFDVASGVTYVLPLPAVGMFFDFAVTKNVTSNSHVVKVLGTGVYLQGSIDIGVAAGTSVTSQGNGTSHTKVSMNGTTTGGLLGTQLHAECLTNSVWTISGNIIGSGSVSTPFA